MSSNLSLFERLIRLLLGAFFLFAAAVLYHHPVARLLSAAFGLFALGEAMTAKCRLVARLGVGSPSEAMTAESRYLLGVVGIQTVLAYEWWSAGWEKVSSPGFVADIGKTLGYFASTNPFPWYKDFLLGFAAKNATVFAYAVEWSQVAIALALAASAVILAYGRNEGLRRNARVVAVLALAGGMLMNANFYLAAGWTGPGTKGSNVVMFWAQAMLLYVWISALASSLKAPAQAMQR